MSLTTPQLRDQLSSSTFSTLSGQVLSVYTQPSHEKFSIGTVVDYCHNTGADETYSVYDLNYASLDDLIGLIKECDFSVQKITLEDLTKQDPDYDPAAHEAIGIYQLKDNQGANYGEIESDIFLQYDPTEDDLKHVFLAMIDRLEIYWEDHFIRFGDASSSSSLKSTHDPKKSKLDRALEQVTQQVVESPRF